MRQLTDRAPAPPIIPNGPFSSPPADPADARSRRPIEAEPSHDRSAIWLRNAAIGLCVLAAAAAALSFTPQYRMVYADRQLAVAAGLEAAIPDAAALVFACLGVAGPCLGGAGHDGGTSGCGPWPHAAACACSSEWPILAGAS